MIGAGIVLLRRPIWLRGLDFWGREGRAAVVKIKVPSPPQNTKFDFYISDVTVAHD